VIKKLNLPLVRLGVEHLAHEEYRVCLVSLDELDKRVLL